MITHHILSIRAIPTNKETVNDDLCDHHAEKHRVQFEKRSPKLILIMSPT